jgi:phage-related protein
MPAGAFRVLYVAKFDDAIDVLHCFQKKTQKTSKADLNLAALRYRDLLKELVPRHSDYDSLDVTG